MSRSVSKARRFEPSFCPAHVRTLRSCGHCRVPISLSARAEIPLIAFLQVTFPGMQIPLRNRNDLSQFSKLLAGSRRAF